MDGLKLIGRNEEELTYEIQIVRTLSTDIKMKFGWEKCARICLTFSVPRFKWPVSFTGPHLNARIRAGRACFYYQNYILSK
jgi:hypothetical protein